MSARPTLNTVSTREIVERIKDVINLEVNKKGLTYDYMVAEELGISNTSLQMHLTRNSLPLFSIVNFCKKKNLIINELIF